MSPEGTKPFLSLQVSDLEKHPVWESILDDDADDLAVFPVKELPVSDLGQRVIGTRVRLANGSLVWAMIWYLDVENARKNQHFANLLIENNGQWFTLSRYWDVDYSRNGPEGLARFLGLSVDEVFPINYDVREYAEGDPGALMGSVLKEPRERLSKHDIIRMAVP